LSKESHIRLSEPKHLRLYDSEGLFVSRISKECIRARVSLQDLFNRELLDVMLPELREKHEVFEGRPCPSEIQKRVHTKCYPRTDKVAERFTAIYCALAVVGTNKQEQSLGFAQQLMHNDPALDGCVREVGLSLIQEEIARLKSRRRVVSKKTLEQVDVIHCSKTQRHQ
jgi:hypothetical protein